MLTLNQFYQIVERKYIESKQIESAVTEEIFVDRVISAGERALHEVSRFERSQESEIPYQKHLKLIELGKVLSSSSGTSLEAIYSELDSSPLHFSSIEKIFLLETRRDINNNRIQVLTMNLKENQDYGFIADPRPEIKILQAENENIDKRIDALKQEYRRVYPKKEIYK